MASRGCSPARQTCGGDVFVFTRCFYFHLIVGSPWAPRQRLTRPPNPSLCANSRTLPGRDIVIAAEEICGIESGFKPHHGGRHRGPRGTHEPHGMPPRSSARQSVDRRATASSWQRLPPSSPHPPENLPPPPAP